MKKQLARIISIALFILFLIPVYSFARYNPDWKWQTIQTDQYTIYYPEGYEPFAQRVLSLSDEVYNDITGNLDVIPKRCPIVLNPGTDLFNGFYSPFPNRISLFETHPYSLRGYGPNSDMMDHVFTHEFTHFTHITTKLGWYGELSNWLGSDSAITNGLSPGWVIEGATTNMETLYTDGGRGRCSYFRGKMMSFTEDEGLWDISAAGTHPPYQAPGDRIYLSGYFMIEYLNRVYGKDALARLGKYQARHPLSYFSIEHVTNRDPWEFYKNFLEDFNQQTNKIKSEARANHFPPENIILSEKLETFSSQFWTYDNTIMALRSGYSKKKALVEINPRNGEIINEINTGRINPLGPVRSLRDNKSIVFGGYFPHPLGGGDLSDSDITQYDMAKKKYKRITKGEHIFSADISPYLKRYVAARRNGMWIDLVLVDSDGKNVQPLISKPGYFFESPSWSPDGSQILTVVKTGRNSDIALVNPETGSLKTLFATDSYEDNDPFFSPDGQWVVFSSNRSGVWNIFAWDLTREKLYQLTSAFYGATHPQVSPDGETLSYFSLHRGVNKLCIMPFAPATGSKQFVKQGGPMNPPDLERLSPEVSFEPRGIPYKEVYKPYLHIPYFFSNEDENIFGLWVLGGDPVGKNSYSVNLNYGLDSEHFGFDASWTNRSFWPDLIARVYSTADEWTNYDSANYWISETGLQLAAGIDIIHRVMPASVTSKLIAGGRYKYLSGLHGIRLNDDINESTSLFGELTLARRPDAAQRDMVPTWGQHLFLSYEDELSTLGGELSGHNTVIVLKQYLPSVVKHHGFELKTAVQNQRGLFYYDKDHSLPRGYSSTDTSGDLHKDNNLLLSAEYHFPLRFTDSGLLSYIHLNALKSSLFVDWGAGWEGDYNFDSWSKKARTVLGGSATAKTTLFSMMPMELGLEAGYKTDEEEGFVNLLLLLGF